MYHCVLLEKRACNKVDIDLKIRVDGVVLPRLQRRLALLLGREVRLRDRPRRDPLRRIRRGRLAVLLALGERLRIRSHEILPRGDLEVAFTNLNHNDNALLSKGDYFETVVRANVPTLCTA